MAVLIFANGTIEDVAWIRPYLDPATAIIAADGGIGHLLALGRLPGMVVGDMDSLSEGVLNRLKAANIALVTHPAEKDETDLELALLLAASRYDDEILLFGALGGRLDHMLANIFLLANPPLDKRRIVLMEEQERAWLVTEATEIQGAAGDTVSLIPLGDDVVVRATTGLYWPLTNEALAFGPARGVSNVMTEDAATVVVGNGRLLCIHRVKRET